MFAKLLKHEWKSTRGLLGWLTLAALGLGVYGTIALRIIVSFMENPTQLVMNPILSVVQAGLMVSLVLAGIGLAVYAVAVQFILLYRFYKHKFTDEGYLTFTLPVKTQQIYWASLVNMAIWELITALVVSLVITLVVLLGTGQAQFFTEEFLPTMGEILGILEAELSPLTIGISVFNALVTLAYGLVLPLACVTIGAVLAKKHKILAAFGTFYAINAGVGTLSSMATILPSILFTTSSHMNPESLEVYMAVITGIETLLVAALTVGGYFLTVHLMKNKLNLP